MSVSPWQKLLRPPQNPRSPAAKRYKQDQVVLKLLRSKYPIIYAGEHGATLSRAESDALVEMLKNKASAYDYKHRVQLLIRILQKGTENLGWDVSIPSPPVIVAREKARFSPDDFMELQGLRCLESAFLEALEKPIPGTASARLGQAILSAILFGGLLHSKWLMPWITSLKTGVCAAEDMLWVDMQMKVAISFYPENLVDKSIKKRPKKEEFWNIRRRWFADPLSHALILRWIHFYPDDLQNLQNAPNPWQCLKYFLNGLHLNKRDYPQSLSALLRMASTRFGLMIPSYLVSYATGRVNSVSLPPEAWIRVVTNKAVACQLQRATGEEAHLRNEPTSIDQRSPDNISMAQQHKLLTGLKRAISPHENDSKRTHTESLKDLERFMSAHSSELVPVLRLLSHWSFYRLTNHSDSGFDYQKRLRPSSALKYLQRIGSVLLAEAGDKNIMSMDPEELQEFYFDAAKAKGSEQSKGDTARILSYFHRYLVAVHGAPIVDFGELHGQSLPAEMRVDANLITPAMFDNVVHVLNGEEVTASRYQEMRILIAVMGFRLGLRRGETRKVCLTDIVGKIQPELIVKNNKYAYAKSSDAIRRIPLRPLLSETEYRKLFSWLELRRSEDNSTVANSLLFSEYGRPTTMLTDEIFSEVEQAIRQVSGDMSLRFHHLRHSFMNWLLVRLTNEQVNQPYFLRHKVFTSKSCSIARKTLLPNDPLGRQSLYALSQLAGHSSPDTTLCTYIHVCDYLLGRELGRPEFQPELTERAIMQVTGLKRAMAFRVRQHSSGNVWRISDFLGGMHKHNNVSLTDPLLKTAKDSDLTPFKGPVAVPFPHWSLMQAVLNKYQLKRKSFEELEAEFILVSRNITLEDIRNWCLISAKIKSMKTNASNPRHLDCDKEGKLVKVFPRRPRLRFDIAIVENIFKIVSRMSVNDRLKLQAGISFFIARFSMEAWSIRFGKFEEAREFISFLQQLGIAKSSIRLRHYPGPDSTAEQCLCNRLRWAKALGLKPEQCIPVGKGNRTGYKGSGSIGIQIKSTYADDCKGRVRVRYGLNYGLRYGVYMLAIALSHSADFGNVDDCQEEMNQSWL